MCYVLCILQYIGSLEVGRPGSRMEIVAAMRRIRVRPHLFCLDLRFLTHNVAAVRRPYPPSSSVSGVICPSPWASHQSALSVLTRKLPVCAEVLSSHIHWGCR